MRSQLFAGLVALSCLSACHDRAQVVLVEKQLVVIGPSDGIANFSALQRSRRPALRTTAPVTEPDGRLKAVVTLPATFTGAELIHTTREALAAGLRYRYVERRFSRPTSA